MAVEDAIRGAFQFFWTLVASYKACQPLLTLIHVYFEKQFKVEVLKKVPALLTQSKSVI